MKRKGCVEREMTEKRSRGGLGNTRGKGGTLFKVQID